MTERVTDGKMHVLADYRYLADGTKIGVTDQSGNGYEYLGSLIYRHTPSGLELESTDFSGGRIDRTTAGYRVNYFVRDYLGSVRAIADERGQRIESMDYLPFGSRWNDPQRLVTDNRYLYNGKEWQPTGDLNVLDYGARHYDPTLGRWFNPDPANEFHNPYKYCGNDPVNYIDPDGCKVYFAAGSSKTFKMRFARTIQFMNERGTSRDIALLERSENIYYIKEGNLSQFDFRNNILYWNPLQIVRTDRNVFLFPATILAHEAKHGVQKDTMDEKEFQQKLKKDDNNPYDRELEKEVITTTEQRAATEHGDKRKDELTRENHKGEIIEINDNGTLPCDKILEDVRKIVLYYIQKIKL